MLPLNWGKYSAEWPLIFSMHEMISPPAAKFAIDGSLVEDWMAMATVYAIYGGLDAPMARRRDFSNHDFLLPAGLKVTPKNLE